MKTAMNGWIAHGVAIIQLSLGRTGLGNSPGLAPGLLVPAGRRMRKLARFGRAETSISCVKSVAGLRVREAQGNCCGRVLSGKQVAELVDDVGRTFRDLISLVDRNFGSFDDA